MSYASNIAPIGNHDARLAELLRRADVEPRPVALGLLLGALEDPYPPIRHRAAEVLADRMEADLSEILAAVVAGREPAADVAYVSGLPPDLERPEIRRAAALALKSSQVSAGARDVLLRAVQSDDDPVVRYHAFLSLHESASDDVLRRAVEAALVDEDPAVSVVACQIVAEKRWLDLVPRVIEARSRLSGPDELQNSLALAELKAVGASLSPDLMGAIVDDLIDALRDEKTSAAAAKALGSLDAPQAIEPLRDLMQKWFAHPLIKVEAAAALTLMGDGEGRAYLGKMLGSRRKDTRGYAIDLVGRLQLDEYRAHVEELVREDDYHADTAALSLGHFVDDRARELLEEVRATHPVAEVREAAEQALRGMERGTDGTV